MKKYYFFHLLRTLSFWIGLSFSSLLAPAQSLLDPLTQSQFVNPLPIPSIIDARNGGLFTIGISQFDQWLGLVDPSTKQPMQTKVWGYNGNYPGPSILAKKNVPVDIFWHNNLVNGNNLPLPHLLQLIRLYTGRSKSFRTGNNMAFRL